MAEAYTDADFADFDPFDGERDVDIKCRTVKVVTTRKQHKCYPPEGKMHAIKAGTRARYETAIVDGKWGSFYTCVVCMTAWLREAGIRPIDSRGDRK